MVRNRDTVIVLNLVLLSVIIFCGEVIYSKMSKARFEAVPVPEKIQQTGTVRTGSAKKPTQPYAAISNRDLLKTETPVVIGDSVDLPAPKATELKLKLWGTVTDESNRQTYAVIEDLETRRQALYRPGAPIQNATVKRVTRGAVILRVEGRDEVLKMASRPPGESDGINLEPDEPSEKTIALERSLFEQAIRNVSYSMNPAGLTRYTENDQYAGLLITTLWPNSLLRLLGLRNGDVLTLVAGEPVVSAQDVVTIFEDLRFATNKVVQVKRQNRFQMLTYDVY